MLLKEVTETVQNEVKQQKGGFLSMLLRTLGASLLVNILVGKGAIARSNRERINEKGRRTNRAEKGYVRAGYGRSPKKNVFLMPPHPLTNFELQKYLEMNQDLMVFIREIMYLLK